MAVALARLHMGLFVNASVRRLYSRVPAHFRFPSIDHDEGDYHVYNKWIGPAFTFADSVGCVLKQQ